MLEIKNLRVAVVGKEILKGINITIKEGSYTAIIGANGSGKTTILKAIIGILKPSSGSIHFPEISKGAKDFLGYSPQENSYFDKLTVDENIEYFGELYGLPKGEVNILSKEIYRDLGLSKKSTELAENLSGGYKRRLNIACSIVHRPKILLLDEPSANVDPLSRISLWKMIENIREKGTSIIICSNLAEEIYELCDRVILLREGKKLIEGNTKQILDRYTIEQIWGD